MRPSGLPLANDVRSVVVGHGLAELHKGIRPHDRGTSETLSNGTFKGPPSIGPGPLRALWVGSCREATFGEWPLFIQARPRPKAEAGDGQLAPMQVTQEPDYGARKRSLIRFALLLLDLASPEVRCSARKGAPSPIQL